MKEQKTIEEDNSSKLFNKTFKMMNSQFCGRHKLVKVTHLCTDNKCQNNPFLCQECLSEGFGRSYHYGHDDNINKIEEAIKILSSKIKIQINPVSKIYKSSLGKAQYASILQKLQKGDFLQEQLNQRIISIKSQIELQLNLLAKEFQKAILLEKQEYFSMLDNYQKIYIRNYDYIRTQTKSLLQFQTQIKYFSNQNNFTMKLINQAKKKTAWILQFKKTLGEIQKKIQTPGFIAEINQILTAANRKQIQLFPHWKNSELSGFQKDKVVQYRATIKSSISNWVFLPDLKNLQQEFLNKNHHQNLSNYFGSKNRGLNSIGSIGSITKNYYSSNQVSKF